MQLLAVPSSVSQILVPLSHTFIKAEMGGSTSRRVWFETSREGVTDREGQDIAADALWDSRNLFLAQGDFDLSHWSKLGNPPGTGMRPEYVIGHPDDVRRVGKSIYVSGRIFDKAPASPTPVDGMYNVSSWADFFWQSAYEQDPPMRWFPSVFGNIPANAKTEVELRKGQSVTVIKGPLEWYSVGFAMRAQHPDLGPVMTIPSGPFAKAQMQPGTIPLERPSLPGLPGFPGLSVMPWANFAKAVQAAAVVTAGDPNALNPMGSLEGVQAIRRESPKSLYKKTKGRVLSRVLSGKVEGTHAAVAECFKKCGMPAEYCAKAATALAREIERVTVR